MALRAAVARVLFVAALLAPGTSASDGTAEVEDAQGDVAYVLSGQGGSSKVHESVDIVRAWLGNETLESFTVGIETVAANSTVWPAPLPDETEIIVNFTSAGIAHAIDSRYCGAGRASLVDYGCIPELRVQNRWEFEVPKKAILTHGDIPIHRGAWIDQWVVHAYDSRIRSEAADRAPDVGAGPSWQLRLGDNSFGNLTIYTPTPVRSSNGEPEAFVFPVTVVNRGGPTGVWLHAQGIPSDWDVHMPDHVRLETGSVTFPVIVSTASLHKHGMTDGFAIDLVPEDASPPARLDLGVHYLAIPQLSRHHNVAHLHGGDLRDDSCASSFGGWFNTLLDDPRATESAIRPSGGGGNSTHHATSWRLALDPPLLLGLDFDLNRSGRFQVDLEPTVASPEAWLEVEVHHCARDQPGRPLMGGRSLSGSVQGGERQPFDVLLHPEQDADLVPYVEDANLQLEVSFAWVGPSPPLTERLFVKLHTEGSILEFPLHAYRDPVQDLFSTANLTLRSDGDTARAANAGQTVWWALHVHNNGDVSRGLAMQAAGPSREHTRALPTAMELAPDETAQVAFAIDVPQASPVGTVLEAYAIIADTADPSAVALAALRVQVVEEPVEPADAPDFAVPKSTPGAPAMLVLLIMWVGARGRARASTCPRRA